MSKIFDASRMKVVDPQPVPAQEPKILSSAISLFDPPGKKQAEDFNRLAQRTLSLRTGARGATLFMASTTSGEGASYVSYHLAMSLGQTYGQRVAWVDANFLSPQKKLVGQGGVSLESLLRDPTDVSKLTADCNPFLLRGGTHLAEARNLVAAHNFKDVLDGLADQFNFVIVDLPPVLDSSETGLMALGGTGFLLVIEQQYLKWEIVEHGVKALRDKGVHVLGTVINRRRFEIPKLIYNRL